MKRNKHSLSHYKLLTCDMGTLQPVGCVEVLPGDTFQHQASTLIRITPQLAPLMHQVSVRLHHFFVPNRLIWSQWEDFITGGPDGNDASVIPTVSTGADPSINPLLDFLGVPQVPNTEVNALPVRAYNMIYNQFYRDQDLINEANLDNLGIHRIAWEKDYFTSARPWQQKGTSVSIPFGSGTADVHTAAATGANIGIYSDAQSEHRLMDASDAELDIATSSTLAQDNKMYANLNGVDALDIDTLREAMGLQRYKEARARYGSRYTEYLKYCGVNPSDQRLQRAEYLGGGRQNISFSEVLQTGPELTGTTPLGEMVGHGIAALRSNRYRKFFEEHGHVITMLSVRPRAIYNDAMSRKFMRKTKEDYYQKELELIGQQEILNKELYTSGTPSVDDAIFGYGDRYREYREEFSSVSGEFRVGDVMDHWHMARGLGSSPTLNKSFIECIPSKRVFAEQNQNELWIMVNHKLQARRMVKRNPAPRII